MENKIKEIFMRLLVYVLCYSFIIYIVGAMLTKNLMIFMMISNILVLFFMMLEIYVQLNDKR